MTQIIAAAVRLVGWTSVAVLMEGWGKAFGNQLRTLSIGVVGEVTVPSTPAAVRLVAATKCADVVKTTGASVWVLWSDFWFQWMNSPLE